MSCCRAEEKGWVPVAVPDQRRGLWVRVNKDSVEFCAGREGDDEYVKIDCSEEQSKLVISCFQYLMYGMERNVEYIDANLYHDFLPD